MKRKVSQSLAHGQPFIQQMGTYYVQVAGSQWGCLEYILSLPWGAHQYQEEIIIHGNFQPKETSGSSESVWETGALLLSEGQEKLS